MASVSNLDKLEPSISYSWSVDGEDIKEMIKAINNIYNLTKDSLPEKRVKSLESFTKSLGYAYKSNDTTILIKPDSNTSFFTFP